jgi:N-acetylglutamate synthase-like GNAT family acetyltransferase
LKINEELNLTWVRIFDPIHIPRELVDQIKDRMYDVDKFYKYQKEACLSQVGDKIVLNPHNLLFVLIDENKLVKGFCWMVVDALDDALVINTFSMNPDYWGNGKAVKLLEEKAKEIQEGAKLKKIFWITRCPRHSQKFGFKTSKHTLMEYIGHGKDINGESSKANGESGSDVSGATTVS